MIIWLASYPKSGNTLLRSILVSLIFSENGNVDFNQLHRISNFPAGIFFEKFTSNYGNIKEISKYWIKVQEVLNKNKKLKFFKTHNALCTIDGNPFTNNKNTIGTIYIIRDPRDVLVSASKYYDKNHTEIKNNMFNRHMDLINSHEGKPISTLLGSWSDHYNSWTKNSKNILLVKYENLINNKEAEIKRIISFINRFTNLQVDENKMKNCIETSSFNSMKSMESDGLFKEGSNDPDGNIIPFFVKGKAGAWRDLLDEKIVKEVENKFQKEMKELGYIN
jgi:hypothetical protein|tara:strand:+ start:293 stop:1126 length:834 start_codon:yes stop_codon:yes gene_type:complete